MGIKALCLVAHPDDCIIFGYGFIVNNSFDWTICYLTHNENSDRAKEMKKFWNGYDLKFLEYKDNPSDLSSRVCTIDRNSAYWTIQSLVKDYDLVLTHNSRGEYGHPHHILVHDLVQHKNVVEFSYPDEGTITYRMPKDTYSTGNLRLHKSAIDQFQDKDELVYNYKKR